MWFCEVFKKIKLGNNECAKFLENLGIAHWSRAYIRGECYNQMISNIAETLNKTMLDGRVYPRI